MLEGPPSRWSAIGSRLRRIERGKLRDLRAWLENTRNLIHVSAVLFVPLLIAAVTALSNAVSLLPFLLFPPLASGTYALFADPESESAAPRRFVGGTTLGALCGWIALEATARYWYAVPPDAVRVRAGAAAFAVFLTGALTWLLDLEESQAFSTALLVLVAEPAAGASAVGAVPGRTSAAFAYVAGVFVSTSLVAGAFLAWRRWFYERRARLLYASTTADDAVLVPMRGDGEATAMLGARLAAAHEAGKVVLLDVVDDPAGVEGSTGAERDRRPRGDGSAADSPRGDEVADHLEARARRIESATGVPCRAAVVAGDADDPVPVFEAARATGCDLIVAPYEARDDGTPTPFVRRLVRGDVDAVVHRSTGGRTDWRRILVPVRHESDVAHAMVEFATRLAGTAGAVSVCHCLAGGRDRDRRRAEEMLADIVEPFDGHGGDAGIETRVAAATPEAFLADHSPRYDLAFVGASADRSTVSRIVSAPTARRLEDLECDLAIVATGSG